jgi:hypothetical protein
MQGILHRVWPYLLKAQINTALGVGIFSIAIACEYCAAGLFTTTPRPPNKPPPASVFVYLSTAIWILPTQATEGVASDLRSGLQSKTETKRVLAGVQVHYSVLRNE